VLVWASGFQTPKAHEMLHKFNKISLGPILANSVDPTIEENYAKILSDYYIYLYVKEIKVSTLPTLSMWRAQYLSSSL